jgi:hypothetical protein
MRALFLVITTLAISGCQPLHRDANPAHGATLMFTSDNLPAQPVICSENGFQETRMAVGRSGLKVLSDLNERLGKAEQVNAIIDAGQGVTAGFKTRRGSRPGSKSRCKIATRFDTEPGGRYQLHLKQENTCVIEVFQLTDAQPLPHPSSTVSWRCP